MATSSETLVLEHERSIPVKVVRCDGPGCDVAVNERDVMARQPRPPVDYEFGTTKGWWFLCENPGESSMFGRELGFHSWACIRNAMLGMPEPGGEDGH